MQTEAKTLAALAAVGAVVGIGNLLASDKPLTVRVILARAIVNGGLGVAAGAASLLIPDIGTIPMFGIAAVISSLGTSALESLFQKWLSK